MKQCVLLTLACLVFAFSGIHAGDAYPTDGTALRQNLGQDDNSPDTPWNHYPTGECPAMTEKVITCSEWRALKGAPGPFEVELQLSSAADKMAGTGESLCVIINAGLYPAIQSSIDQYIIDVTADGYDVAVYTSSGGTPEDLRSFLQDRYAEGMDGVLFIGDLPVAWWEGGDIPMNSGPRDAFFMDMDGVWTDTDGDGDYDQASLGPSPDIWFGRLSASTLTYTGETEAQLINNYFRKNHLYRTGDLETLHIALLYDDFGLADSAETCVECFALRWAYPEQVCVWDPDLTYAADFSDRLEIGYELVFIESHGSVQCQSFTGGTFFIGHLIDSTDLRSNFFIANGCTNGRFTDTDYIAGWYIFDDEYGLGSIADPFPTAGWADTLFYQALGDGKSFGASFMEAMAINGDTPRRTVFGDPTLQLVFCDVSDGDQDGDLVADDCDNCPHVNNPDQADADVDHFGDPCDNCYDTDHDGWGNPKHLGNVCPDDNCPDVYNPDQADIDYDEVGDMCDDCVDQDNDGFGSPGYPATTCVIDNCPDVYNPDQTDTDGDGNGDVCDICPGFDDYADFDVDGIPDSCDNCPDVLNPDQDDFDGDGIGDLCDLDIDADGLDDNDDNCPCVYNPDQVDSDADGLGDACDCVGVDSVTWVSIADLTSFDRIYDIERISTGGYMAVGNMFDTVLEAIAVRFNECGQPVAYYMPRLLGDSPTIYSVDETPDAGWILGGEATTEHDHLTAVRLRPDMSEAWRRQIELLIAAIRSTVSLADGRSMHVGWYDQGAVGWRLSEDGANYMWLKWAANNDGFHDVQVTSDGGYVMCGFAEDPPGDTCILVVKADANLNIVWEARPEKSSGYFDVAYSIDTTADGDYVIAGTRTNPGTGMGDCFVMKIAADSHLVWKTVIDEPGYDDAARSIHLLDDGTFAVGGWSDFGHVGEYDGQFTHVDDDGMVIRRWWDTLPGNQTPYDIELTADGYLLLAGESDGDFYLNKFGGFQSGGQCCVLRGDANHDGEINVGDPVYIINYVMKGGAPPVCDPEADANNDCYINLGDAVYLIDYNLKGGPAPPDCSIPCGGSK